MTREEALRALGYRGTRWAAGIASTCRPVYHYPVYCTPSQWCGLYGMFKRPTGTTWVHIRMQQGVIYGGMTGVFEE